MSGNGSIADGLRRQVEELAVAVMTQESPAAPEALRALAAALEETRRQAAEAGWEEVARIAGELAGARPDDLRQGIARLQAAVENPPSAHAASLTQDTDLLNDIVMESTEHLISIENQLLTLEQDPAHAEAIHSAFRGFHTIKGLAGFMELNAIQAVAHEVENILDLARNKKLKITPSVIDVVLAGKDYLQHAFRLLEPALHGGQPGQPPDNTALIARIKALAENPEGAEQPQPGVETRRDAAAASGQASEARMVKVDTGKLDFLVDMAGEMVIAQSQITHDPDLKSLESPRLQRNLAHLSRITEEIQKTAMSMRMVPIGLLFRRMHRLVRDLARKAGKQVELELAGEDTELDRTIVEALSDPLIHMVRNSVDHGIEKPEVRRSAGKNPVGRVGLKACHQAGSILIEICDDGCGINRERVLSRALERGLIQPGAAPPDNEILNLILEPGFSTAERVTDVSGRGVGMDVVRKQVMKLRGRIDIQSVEGKGTTFFLKLPLTLAIIDGLVVGVGRERYIVPLFAVREMFRPAPGMVTNACNQGEVVLIRGRLLPLVRLYRRFNVKPRTEDPCESVFLVAESGSNVFCLMVDEFTGKQEVVIKSLGETMKNIPGIAGGAILGDGRVGLVLDLDGVFEQEHDHHPAGV